MNLSSILTICDKHVDQIEYVMKKLTIPLTSLDNLSRENKIHLDTLLYRFSQLQDIMGTRLFPAFLSVFAPKVEESFIDKINQLQKFDFEISKERWFNLRKRRNMASHDYPDDESLHVEHINQMYAEVPYLLNVYQQIKAYVTKNT